jgi:hypothetical protein
LAQVPEYLPPHTTLSISNSRSKASPTSLATDWRSPEIPKHAFNKKVSQVPPKEKKSNEEIESNPAPHPGNPRRSSQTLSKLLEAAEKAQRAAIRARVSGHLNHDKVFAQLPFAQHIPSFGDGSQSLEKDEVEEPAIPFSHHNSARRRMTTTTGNKNEIPKLVKVKTPTFRKHAYTDDVNSLLVALQSVCPILFTYPNQDKASVL